MRKKPNAIVKSYLRNIKNDMIADSIELLNRSERNIKLISNIEEYFEYFDNGTWTTQEIIDSAKKHRNWAL
jgi:isochorismate hydrolase